MANEFERCHRYNPTSFNILIAIIHMAHCMGGSRNMDRINKINFVIGMTFALVISLILPYADQISLKTLTQMFLIWIAFDGIIFAIKDTNKK